MNIFKNINLKNKYFYYVEGVIYVLLTILIVFSSIAGPIVIRLLPLIFLLGIVGKTVFNRSVITSIFGFLVSLCTIYITSSYGLVYNLMYSLFCFISIVMGEVCGIYLIRYKESRSKELTRKNVKNIIISVIIIFVGIYLNIYINGNMYSYLKCKSNLKEYIQLNYPGSENVKIYNGNYVLDKYNYYSFYVKNIDKDDNSTYKFGVYLNNKIIDGYMNGKLSQRSQILRVKFLKSMDLSLYKDFDLDIAYTDLDNNITLYITKHVKESNSDELNKFTEDVNNILDRASSFNKFGKISKMYICVQSEEEKLNAEVYNTNFYDEQYYIDALQTEYLDK